MCGIAGILPRSREGDAADENRVRAALARMRHRGPDDEGVCRSSGAVLGHRRLSILDLSPAGHQPMHTGDGRFFCSLNGEIYNYLELRAELGSRGRVFRTGTDTEVLLAAFAQWGVAAIERFRGQFAVAIWDAVEQRLVLARDRVGEKPLHYWRDRERLVFASEIKALLDLMPSPPPLRPDSINTYLHYQYVIEPDTLLEGVHKLPAGSFLTIDAQHWNAEPQRYWSLAAVPPVDGDPIELMRAALHESVSLTLRSDAPVGVALSGGLDSGVIAAIAARERPDLTAFTVGYPGHRDFDERGAASGLAATLGIPWKSAELPTSEFVTFFPRLVELLDEPIADVAAFGHYAVSRLAAANGVKVLLTGIGGDELFFGYGWVRRALELSRAKLDARRSATSWFEWRARLLRTMMERTPLLTLLTNRRLPRGWRDYVDRQFDPGRLDLDRPDEWVFYQLDYHWQPAVEFTAAVFTPEFAAQLSPRGAYRLMAGLSSDPPPEIAVTAMLFDSWLVSNCLDLGDRVSMASSVETRVPLLEAGVIDTAVGLWRQGRRDEAQGHKTWLRAIARDLLPAEYVERPKLGFITPTVEWTQAVNAAYASLVDEGMLSRAKVVDPGRLRAWRERTRPGIRRDFLLYKITLLELWCRIVLGGERPERMGGIV
jgi:asparagine synthase (glutamine-hydrolysing)